MTNQLVDRRRVERAVNPYDRRYRVLLLTPKGSQVRDEVLEAALAETPLAALTPRGAETAADPALPRSQRLPLSKKRRANQRRAIRPTTEGKVSPCRHRPPLLGRSYPAVLLRPTGYAIGFAAGYVRSAPTPGCGTGYWSVELCC